MPQGVSQIGLFSSASAQYVLSLSVLLDVFHFSRVIPSSSAPTMPTNDFQTPYSLTQDTSNCCFVCLFVFWEMLCYSPKNLCLHEYNLTIPDTAFWSVNKSCPLLQCNSFSTSLFRMSVSPLSSSLCTYWFLKQGNMTTVSQVSSKISVWKTKCTPQFNNLWNHF